MTTAVVRQGAALCHREPLNDEKGLEGFNEGESYSFELMTNSGSSYYRLFHHGWERHNKDNAGAIYYETVGPHDFLKFFKENE